MANYSADTDLGLYLRESDKLPPLYETHTEAKRIIDAYLRSKGISDADILLLGTTTLAQLKVASCYWVLGTFFGGFVGDQGAAEASSRYLGQYQAQMSSVYIEYAGSEGTTSDTLTSGDCLLG